METHTLTVFDSVEQAKNQANAIASILGTTTGINIREGLTPVLWLSPTYDESTVTHGVQAAETLLGKLVTRMTTQWGEAPEGASECLKVDEHTRVCEVDYKRLTEQVRNTFPGDTGKLTEFQVFVQEALAAEALRGISFK